MTRPSTWSLPCMLSPNTMVTAPALSQCWAQGYWTDIWTVSCPDLKFQTNQKWAGINILILVKFHPTLSLISRMSPPLVYVCSTLDTRRNMIGLELGMTRLRPGSRHLVRESRNTELDLSEITIRSSETDMYWNKTKHVYRYPNHLREQYRDQSESLRQRWSFLDKFMLDRQTDRYTDIVTLWNPARVQKKTYNLGQCCVEDIKLMGGCWHFILSLFDLN